MGECDTGNMVEDKLATVTLFRFDPEVDDKPWYSEFKAPYEGYTVLDVLLHIQENLDGAIAFRWGCGKGFCRSCVVSVNEKPMLPCNAPAVEYMKIEPHPKFKVLKDLIVDLDKPE